MIISMANNKGGVSKTTSTICLADAIAKEGKRVLIIDLDSQSSLTIYLGYEPLKIEYSIYDVLVDKISAKEAIIKTDMGVDLTPSTIDLSIAEMQLITAIGREYILKNKLMELENDYDYIFIDNSPSLSLLTLNSFVASDFVIAPCTPDYLAMRGLEILMQSINQIKKTVNNQLEFLGVIITMHKSTKHHKEVTEILRKNYACFKDIIGNSIKFSDACLAQQSIIDFAGKNYEDSKAYINIAKEIMSYGE